MKLRNSPFAKIAIVDDSDLTRKTIIEILEKEGLEIVGDANSAERALQLAATTPVNIFLIDVVMPDVGGLELLKHIINNYQGIYVIMMSSLNSEDINLEAISNGALDVLQKPFDKETLLKAVLKIAQRIEKENSR
jgi:DNA-binding NarL/FixJ family response regulator